MAVLFRNELFPKNVESQFWSAIAPPSYVALLLAKLFCPLKTTVLSIPKRTEPLLLDVPEALILLKMM